MKGNETNILSFLEGADKRFEIPVYQRHYSWVDDNCRQLFDDIVKVSKGQRPSHFCGSVVAKVIGNGRRIEYHIIDGQQRLTTVTLLLLAMRNLINDNSITTEQESLAEQINEKYLVDKWHHDDSIKLCPVESDRDALRRLFAAQSEDYIETSRLTLSYQFFCKELLSNKIAVDRLFEALQKLEIVSITLDNSDNAQLIFESLNSTGLALTEGDKIRNYILMDLAPDEQAKFYNDYWLKIEQHTRGDVSALVRDYLSIKQHVTPRIDRIYPTFKEYTADSDTEALLQQLLRYARLYNQILECRSELKNKQIDDCLHRLNHLEITVIRPFLLEVLSHRQDNKITTEDTLKIFLTVESYIFRRYICEVPINALSKLFAALDNEIRRYDDTNTDDYYNKFIFALRSKTDSGCFPNDDEFKSKLAMTDAYHMPARYRFYIFERYENYGTKETKDVYEHIKNKDYTIEHIMPQQLTTAWERSLGERATDIHQNWLHRLANLTLTAYNSKLSNKPFIEKRDGTNGYKQSGLRINQIIAQKNTWSEAELIERNDNMIEQALKIWPLPQTDYQPIAPELPFCTLAEYDIDLTNTKIAKYNYKGNQQSTDKWSDMFENIVTLLHADDSSVLTALARSDINKAPDNCVSRNPENLRQPHQIDDNIYIEKNTSTATKIALLRQLFDLYGIDYDNLIFYLKDNDDLPGRFELRKKYWTFALPIIRELNKEKDLYKKAKPVPTEYINGYIGIKGVNLNCIALYDSARVEIYFGSNYNENKKAFDTLAQHKSDIEKELGAELMWDRGDTKKSSTIKYCIHNVSIANQDDWQRMAEFHGLWVSKFYQVIDKYLSKQESLF